ncbi:multicopper oxidase family protein [Actinoplanes sp. NPDC048796]|uniref:multicopper oxidase family protein n=1 Tax=unclassified Actinoplanes TaxID=2626549 RepID=UPI00340E1541
MGDRYGWAHLVWRAFEIACVVGAHLVLLGRLARRAWSAARERLRRRRTPGGADHSEVNVVVFEPTFGEKAARLVSRRHALSVGVLAVTAGAVVLTNKGCADTPSSGRPSSGTPTSDAHGRRGAGPSEWVPPRNPPKASPPVAHFTLPFVVPPVQRPVRDDAGGTYYAMTQREASIEIIPGLRTPIMGYEGVFPGPTIMARSGRPTIVDHTNRLAVPVAVHLHGGKNPPGEDGHPTDLMAPGTSRRYTYPTDQRGATLWYHDHRLDFTGPQVYRGLAGFHIIRDAVEDSLPLPAGAKDVPLLVTDRLFEADGAMYYPSSDPTLRTPGLYPWAMNGQYGDTALVNGVPWPRMEVSATKYRFRVLNASNARHWDITLDPPPPSGDPFVQVGSDGGLLSSPVALRNIVMSPAERFDVVIDFGLYPVGTRVVLRNNDRTVPQITELMCFDVVRRETETATVPSRLAPPLDLPDPADAVGIRHFDFTRRADGMWGINGAMFDDRQSLAAPALGSTEIWEFTSDVAHPVHLHLVHFRVLSRSRPQSPEPWDGGWKDTVRVRPGETVRIVSRFEGWRGKYVFHCHNLEHEDMMMMANFTVQ